MNIVAEKNIKILKITNNLTRQSYKTH